MPYLFFNEAPLPDFLPFFCLAWPFYIHALRASEQVNDGCTTKTTFEYFHNEYMVCLWCFMFRFLHLFTTPKLQAIGGIESVAAISMGHGAPVWPLPAVRTCRHRFGIGNAWCGRLHLRGPSGPRTVQQSCLWSTVRLPRLGHVWVLLLGLSGGARHLDGR